MNKLGLIVIILVRFLTVSQANAEDKGWKWTCTATNKSPQINSFTVYFTPNRPNDQAEVTLNDGRDVLSTARKKDKLELNSFSYLPTGMMSLEVELSLGGYDNTKYGIILIEGTKGMPDLDEGVQPENIPHSAVLQADTWLDCSGTTRSRDYYRCTTN